MSSYAWIHGKKVFLQQNKQNDEDSDLDLFRIKNQQSIIKFKIVYSQRYAFSIQGLDVKLYGQLGINLNISSFSKEESEFEHDQNQDTDEQQSYNVKTDFNNQNKNAFKRKSSDEDEEPVQNRAKEMSFQCNQKNQISSEQLKQQSRKSMGSKQNSEDNNVAKQMLSLQTQQTTEKTDKFRDSLRVTPKKKDFIFLNKMATKIKTPKIVKKIEVKEDKPEISELSRILAEKKFKSIEIVTKSQQTQTTETFHNRIITKLPGPFKNNNNQNQKRKGRQTSKSSVSPMNNSQFVIRIELKDQETQTQPQNLKTQETTPRRNQIILEAQTSAKKRFYIPLHERFPYEMERKKQLLTRIRKRIEDQEQARKKQYKQEEHRVSVFNCDHSFVREKENFEESRLQKELEQLRQCTYSPKISSRSKQIATRRFESQGFTKTEDRLIQYGVEKQAHLRQLTKELDNKTMQPFKISPNSREIMKRLNISPQNSTYNENGYGSKRNFDNQYSYIQDKNLNSSWF